MRAPARAPTFATGGAAAGDLLLLLGVEIFFFFSIRDLDRVYRLPLPQCCCSLYRSAAAVSTTVPTCHHQAQRYASLSLILQAAIVGAVRSGTAACAAGGASFYESHRKERNSGATVAGGHLGRRPAGAAARIAKVPPRRQ